MKKYFTSLLEALQYFGQQPACVAMILREDFLEHPHNHQQYALDDVRFVKTYKFEEASDPGYVSYLYLVDLGNKQQGYFVDASWMYANFVAPDI